MITLSKAAMHLAVVGNKDGKTFFWNSMDDAIAKKPGIEIHNMPDNLAFAVGGDVILNNKPVGFFVTYEDVIRWVDKINNLKTR